MKISEKLQRLRAEYNLLQADIAKIAGVSIASVSNWEKGLKSPRLGPIQKICHRFGIDVNVFADESNDIYMATNKPPVDFRENLLNLIPQLPEEDLKVLWSVASRMINTNNE